jgi:four helix bundle protein
MSSDFKNLIAWQKAMDLVDAVYEAADCFPQKEIYGLTAQVKRAVVSVASNIAEGQARYSKPDFRRFLRQARGSLAEVQTQLLIAERRRYLAAQKCRELESQIEEIARIVNGLLRSLTPAPADS